MKTEIFKRPWPAFARKRCGAWPCATVMAVSLLIASKLMAMPVVQTISGGPSYGYVDGNTKSNALFHTPIGLAWGIDPAAGTILYVADRDNNAIRKLDLDLNQTITFATNGINRINQPVGVALDGDGNLYVLNRGNGNNGTVLKFNRFGNFLGTNAVALINANGIALDGGTNIYVTVNGNAVLKISPAGVKTNVATINIPNTSLQGVAVTSSGYLAVCDSGRHGIWMINPTDGTKFQLTGFHGPGDTFGARESAQFNQPYGIAAAGGGMLVVTDYGNHRVKTVDSQGTVSSLYGVCASDWNVVPGNPSVLPGWWDGNGCPSETTCQTCDNFAEARWPKGVVVAPNGDVYTTEVYYHLIRQTTATGLTGSQPGYPPLSPFFNGPMGIALDSSGISYMFIADQTNNAVKLLDFGDNSTTTFLSTGDGIDHPVDVALDSSDYLFVLNQGTNGNGAILEFEPWGFLLGTIAAGLTNPTALALDGAGNIFVAEQTGAVKVFVPGVSSNTIATITNAGVNLQGIGLFDDGTIAVSDAGNHVMWQINPFTRAVSRLTGQLGSSGNSLGTTNSAKLNQPHKLARAAGNRLVAADYGNNRLVVVERSGWITNRTILISTNSLVWFGQPGDPVAPGSPNWVPMVSPVAVAVGPGGAVYSSEILTNDCIRKILNTGVAQAGPLPPGPPPAPTILTVTTNYGEVSLTWSAVAGATNYIVRRSPSSGGPYANIATTTATSFTDTSVVNGTTYYYVVSASNAGGEGPNSAEVSATPPMPPVPDPQVGYVDFPPPGFTSVFHPVSSVVFNNDKPIVIVGAAGTQTFYEYADTLVFADVPNPTASSASAPVGYEDGLFSVIGLTVASVSPALTIKAVGQQPGRPNSAIVTAQFQFIVGNPLIIGNNAAQFTVSDITDGAELWYTTDVNREPTNALPSQFAGTIVGTNAITLSLSFPSDTTNMWFKIRGFKANYQPSGVVSTLFSTTNFSANKISFGLTSGEPSSKFLARPGQFFYAPVTLGVLPGEVMYSLQFNAAVTNGLTNPNTGVRPPAIQNGAGIDFFTMLMSQVPPVEGTYFPPADGQWYLKIPPYIYNTFPDVNYDTNGVPVATNTITTPFVRSVFTNTANNLLGIGWLFRTGFKYKYLGDPTGERNIDFDTTAQDLITYSIAHDTLFKKANGVVVVGAYSFQVPNDATNGDKYFIQLGSPSATRDGVGAPGADVYIQSPSASQAVTVTNTSYLVGDVAPFHWFNAGDFGNSNLLNDDVMQVYQAAIELVDMPPDNSDFFASMDSCGTLGTFDSANGYFTNAGTMTPTQIQAMFDGSDPTINEVAFGDNPPNLDVCDLFVTFRRSLDPSLYWFRRFWTNGQLVAVTNTNLAFNSNSPSAFPPPPPPPPPPNGSYQDSFVSFAAGDGVVGAGQTIQIPITAKILGDYPLRVLGLNLTVRPLDGSPGLTQPIHFTPAAGLGSPTIGVSGHAGTVAGAWLNRVIAGLSNNASLGTLVVTVPTSATSASAYAVHFDHASASPNGIARFPKQTQTGVITASDRSASSWNDGIPDSWRLRYFGTINNLLSAATADADGDGATNWHEYKAGTDPNDAASVLRLRSSRGQTQDFVIRWPSAANKQYVVERSSSLSVPTWTSISTNAGTGLDIEFHDNTGGTPTRFYRVRPLD